MSINKADATLTGNPDLVDSNFDNPQPDPLCLLQQWLNEADKLEVCEPRGLVLSTVNISAKPSSRVVLLKAVDDRGIIFASSDMSQKGKDLKMNPFAAGTLWWRETMQQVNLQGYVTKLSEKVSEALFHQRTREAQAIAAVSRQSSPLSDEAALRCEQLKLVEQQGPISRPSNWYVYHLMIQSIEFWHGSQDRFHKRLRYELVDNIWQYQKLQP